LLGPVVTAAVGREHVFDPFTAPIGGNISATESAGRLIVRRFGPSLARQ
jgi:hypothetical protein